MTQEKEKIKFHDQKDSENLKSQENFLILHNDEHNLFDYVVDSLIDICEHDPHQAEQCTLIVHYKGKCDVKKGSFKVLEPFKKALDEKGLTVTIE